MAFSVLDHSVYNVQSLQQLFCKNSSDQESDSESLSKEAIKVGSGDPKGALFFPALKYMPFSAVDSCLHL